MKDTEEIRKAVRQILLEQYYSNLKAEQTDKQNSSNEPEQVSNLNEKPQGIDKIFEKIQDKLK